jgi:hypothetical protein
MAMAAATGITGFFVSIAAVSAQDTAAGQGASPGVEQRADKVFARLDSNADGAVSRTEAQFKRQQRFARLDRNADGMLSMEEYMAPLDRRFQALDTNADDTITPNELAAGIEKIDRAGME